MKIRIIGWEKINARKDVRNPYWFKFKHKFFEDPDFYDFTHAEKLCWIYILCEASKKNATGNMLLSLPHANNVGGINTTEVKSTIKKLQRLQMIEVRTLRGRYGSVRDPGARQEEIRIEEIRIEETCERSNLERISVDVGFQSLEIVIQERKINPQLQRRWLDAFPDPEWVVSEIKKALAWEEANPTRRKKNFGAFITRWLSKGWDYRKTKSGKDPDSWLNEKLKEIENVQPK